MQTNLPLPVQKRRALEALNAAKGALLDFPRDGCDDEIIAIVAHGYLSLTECVDFILAVGKDDN